MSKSFSVGLMANVMERSIVRRYFFEKPFLFFPPPANGQLSRKQCRWRSSHASQKFGFEEKFKKWSRRFLFFIRPTEVEAVGCDIMPWAGKKNHTLLSSLVWETSLTVGNWPLNWESRVRILVNYNENQLKIIYFNSCSLFCSSLLWS